MRHLVLLTVLVALAACERADDLDVAVAPVVQGAPIDASMTAMPDEQPIVVPEPAVVDPVEPIEPEEAAPAAMEPEPTDPSATEPEATEPEATDPSATEPEATEPEVTEPEVTEPEVTEPEASEPDATEPETAGGDGAAADSASETVALGDTGDDGDPPLDDEGPEPPQLIDGVWYTSFDYLGSFDSGIMAIGEDSVWAQHAETADSEENGEVGIPRVVKALDQQIVELEGYMIPLKFEKGNVRTFYLSRYMMSCCFGMLPKANEVVEVEMMNKDGALYDAYMPIVVKGLFEVHEEGAESEYLKTVFTMKGDEYRFSDEW